MNFTPEMRAEDYSGPGGQSAHSWPSISTPADRAVIGLRVFLVVVSSLFFLLILAWFMRSQFNDWEALSHPWQPLSQAWQLWLNTGLLIVSSVSLQWARIDARRPSANINRVKTGAFLGGLFTLLFLAGQLLLWQQLSATGYVVAANPANSFFYLLTGLHGLHLAGGLVAWARLLMQFRHKEVSVKNIRLSVELCAIYWHYLLFIWLLLFGLLISPPATFELIASFCSINIAP